jgi:hypothetical protein
MDKDFMVGLTILIPCFIGGYYVGYQYVLNDEDYCSKEKIRKQLIKNGCGEYNISTGEFVIKARVK